MFFSYLAIPWVLAGMWRRKSTFNVLENHLRLDAVCILHMGEQSDLSYFPTVHVCLCIEWVIIDETLSPLSGCSADSLLLCMSFSGSAFKRDKIQICDP